MSESSPAANSDHDVFWTATRYVCNELTESERAAFEEQLTTDEAACLSLADAVRVSAALNSSISLTVRPVDLRPAPQRRMLAAAACCLAALLAGFMFLNGQAWQNPSSQDLASAELVSRWTTGVTDSLFDELALDDEFDIDAEMAEDPLAAPDWLLAAVKMREEEANPSGDPRLQEENL